MARLLVAAATVLASLGLAGHAEALYNCEVHKASNNGYTICRDGTGYQRARGTYYNGVQYVYINGPCVGVDQTSWVITPYGYPLTSLYSQPC